MNQKVTRLAVQREAELAERLQPDERHVTLLQLGQVVDVDPDLLGQFGQRHLPLRQNDVEPDIDAHTPFSSSSKSFLPLLCTSARALSSAVSAISMMNC